MRDFENQWGKEFLGFTNGMVSLIVLDTLTVKL
jgi:hypothetical protein